MRQIYGSISEDDGINVTYKFRLHYVYAKSAQSDALDEKQNAEALAASLLVRAQKDSDREAQAVVDAADRAMPQSRTSLQGVGLVTASRAVQSAAAFSNSKTLRGPNTPSQTR